MQKITMTTNKNLSLEEAFNLFKRKCEIKNLTFNTIRSYEEKCGHFIEYINKDTLVADIDTNTVDDYILYLRKNSNANESTVCSYIRHLRAFLYFLMENNYLPHFKVKLPKVEKKLKETYTDEELHALLRKPNIKTCGFTEYKTWVFENYLLATGNRISSALNVKIEDIDFNNYLITLRKTKNRRQQIIPLSATLADILKEYLTYRQGNSDDYLFCNIYGHKPDMSTFQQAVKRYNHSRGVDKTSCHLFRHTFAKKWILNGGDIFRLQKMLGHSDISVTKEYVTMFSNDLQLDFEQFNPLDTLNVNNKNTIKIK